MYLTSMLRKMSSCLQVSKLPLKPAAVVHRQTFEMPEVKQFVEELSVDGGKIRIHSQREPCRQEYRVRLHDLEAIRAYFQDNDALIEWSTTNRLPHQSPVWGWA